MQTVQRVRNGYVHAQGIRLHYREWGNPDNPDVLILHGLSGHCWEFDDLAEFLSDRFHVVVLDQRGHGASEYGPSYTPDVMAEDIGYVVEALELADVRVVGHSMGGINAWLFAARNPGIVERLAILDVGPDTGNSEWAQTKFPVLLPFWENARYADPEEAVTEYLTGADESTHETLRRFVLNNLIQKEGGQWGWRFDAAGLISFIEEHTPSHIQWDVVRRLTFPVLILHAGRSEAFSRETAQRMAREIPNARCVEIPDAGHDLHFDQPEMVFREVRSFLEQE